ncbi:exosortase/archaeosortase family protein [Patescibacteria group bacterium]|nr:exosortase/archaeosortase family protein [Patescibacteria group bacterium]MBU1673263.1 exosortase/archaeosortase family protein [Patescibacteria group bacterium]MBU1963524.1 exosortase/archaeosortase family protein [Patescibacteria group bacterium]
MPALEKVKDKFSTGFFQFIALGILFVVIIFVEKQFFPSSKELVQFNVVGRSSVVLPLLMMLVFFAWTKDKLFKVKKFAFRYKQAIFFGLLHLGALFAFIALKNFIIYDEPIALEHFNLIVFLRYLLPALVVIFLALALFSRTFIRHFIWPLLGSAVLGWIFFQLSLYFKRFWEVFSDAVGYSVFWLLQLFGQNPTFSESNFGPVIGFPEFSLRIEAPCSGIESISLFIFLFALIVIIDRKKLIPWRAVSMFVIGILGVFLVNILRIFILFLIAIYIDLEFAVHTFHTNAGWILFIMYFGLFWFFVYGFINKKQIDTNIRPSDLKD